MSKTIYWLAAIDLAAIGACLAAAAYTDYPMLWVAIAAVQGCLLGLHLAAAGRQRFDRKVAERHLLASIETARTSSFGDLALAVAVAEDSLDSIGDGDWTPQDYALSNLVSVLFETDIIRKKA